MECLLIMMVDRFQYYVLEKVYLQISIKSTISGLSSVKLSYNFIQCPGKQNKGVIIVYLPGVGAKIKQLRSQRNMSQIVLAQRLGVSKSVISSYENSVHLPPYDVLIQLARIFGVSTDYLLGTANNKSINVDGLTDTQIEAITMIVNELKATNKDK